MIMLDERQKKIKKVIQEVEKLNVDLESAHDDEVAQRIIIDKITDKLVKA